MGLETHVDRILMEKRLLRGNDYRWENGLKPMGFASTIPEDIAKRIMKVLDRSDEFGPTRYNKRTNKIEFGVVVEFFSGKLTEYGQYRKDFKNWLVDREGKKVEV
jgi:hypothetical protein